MITSWPIFNKSKKKLLHPPGIGWMVNTFLFFCQDDDGLGELIYFNLVQGKPPVRGLFVKEDSSEISYFTFAHEQKSEFHPITEKKLGKSSKKNTLEFNHFHCLELARKNYEISFKRDGTDYFIQFDSEGGPRHDWCYFPPFYEHFVEMGSFHLTLKNAEGSFSKKGICVIERGAGESISAKLPFPLSHFHYQVWCGLSEVYIFLNVATNYKSLTEQAIIWDFKNNNLKKVSHKENSAESVWFLNDRVGESLRFKKLPQETKYLGEFKAGLALGENNKGEKFKVFNEIFIF